MLSLWENKETKLTSKNITPICGQFGQWLIPLVSLLEFFTVRSNLLYCLSCRRQREEPRISSSPKIYTGSRQKAQRPVRRVDPKADSIGKHFHKNMRHENLNHESVAGNENLRKTTGSSGCGYPGECQGMK